MPLNAVNTALTSEQEILLLRQRIAELEGRVDALSVMLERQQELQSELISVLDHLPSTIGYWDRSLRNRFANAAYRTWWNVDPIQLGGMHIRELLGEPLFALNQPHLEAALAGKPQVFERLMPASEDQQPRQVLVHYNPDLRNGEIQGICVLVSDITPLQQAQAQLRLAASVFETSLDGIIITDSEFRIIDVNPAFTRITGYERDAVLGANPRTLGSPRQAVEVFVQMRDVLTRQGTWRGELWNRRNGGEDYPVLLSISAVRDEHQAVMRYVGVFSDISRIKEHEAELERIALYDPLTGLPNRRWLSQQLELSVSRALNTGQVLAVCYLDLDGFKAVNDQHGHEAGDQLLIRISQQLRSTLLPEDKLIRLGGDEFVLLLEDIHPSGDRGFQTRLRRALEAIARPVDLSSRLQVSISASIGVTVFPQDGSDPETLLRHADQAMYTAKESGRNRYNLFAGRARGTGPQRPSAGSNDLPRL